MKKLLFIICFILSAIIYSCSYTSELVNNNDGANAGLTIYPPEIIYKNVTIEERNDLDTLPEEQKLKALRSIAIYMALGDYYQAAEDGFITFTLTREEANRAGILDSEYDRMLVGINMLNLPFKQPIGKVVRGAIPDSLTALKERMKKFCERCAMTQRSLDWQSNNPNIFTE